MVHILTELRESLLQRKNASIAGRPKCSCLGLWRLLSVRRTQNLEDFRVHTSVRTFFIIHLICSIFGFCIKHGARRIHAQACRNGLLFPRPEQGGNGKRKGQEWLMPARGLEDTPRVPV